MSKLGTFTVFGEKVCAHDKGCAASYRSDRQHGLRYGQFELETGEVVGWAEASRRAHFCVYCGPERIGPFPPADPALDEAEARAHARAREAMEWDPQMASEADEEAARS